MGQPLDDLDIWGDDERALQCVTCDFFAPPESGAWGHCVQADPGRRGRHGRPNPYPRVRGSDRACQHHPQRAAPVGEDAGRGESGRGDS